jgi:hypothetical protein
MREQASPHPPGTVGVLVGSLARYRALFTSIEKLKVPAGTNLIYAEGPEVARNCNTLVDEMTGEWLWIMGDDHRFEPDTLLKLLERRLDIVVPLVTRRHPPFESVLYKTMVADGAPNVKYALHELPQGGLLEVDAAGSAGMLVRQHVFASLPRPWFEFQRHTSEDVGFCLNARAAGFKVHADLDRTMTHITTCELEPRLGEDGKWAATVNIGGEIFGLTKVQAEQKAVRNLRAVA